MFWGLGKLGLLLDPSPLGHHLGPPLVSCQGAVGAPGHPYGMLRSWVGVLSPSQCRCWGWSSPISPTHSRTSQDPKKHQCRGDPIPGAAPGLEKDGLGSQSCVSQLGPTAAGRPIPAPGNSWELLAALPSLLLPVPSAELHPLHCFLRVTGRTPGTLWGPFSASPAPAAPVPPAGASSSCAPRSFWKGASYGVPSSAPGSFTPRCAVIRAGRDREDPGSGSLGTAG